MKNINTPLTCNYERLSAKIPMTQKNFIFIPRLYSNHLNSALIKVHITKKLKSNELRTPFHTYCLAHNTQLLNTVSQFCVLLNTHFYCDNHTALLHKRYKKKIGITLINYILQREKGTYIIGKSGRQELTKCEF